MANQPSFFSLPREIRDIIYDYALEDVEFTNALECKSAYTFDRFPLLYVEDTISKELQPVLYRNHAIVIPIQEPCQYTIGKSKFAPQLSHCSKMMKRRSKTLVIESCQTKTSHYEDAALDENGEPEEALDYWGEEDGGKRFALKLVDEILAIKPDLPAVTTIKLNFWFGSWIACNDHWAQCLEMLLHEWPEIMLDIEFNMFGYVDSEAGNGGSNWIQVWHKWSERTESTWFAANNFKWTDHEEGNFQGHQIDIEAWEGEEFVYMSPKEQAEALRYFDVEEQPMFVKTGPFDGYE